MASKLIFVCGNYANALNVYRLMEVVGQTTETGHQMVELGENVGLKMLQAEREILYLFSNNDHFLNGIRLACAKGRIDADQVSIVEFGQSADEMARFTINDKGRVRRILSAGGHFPLTFTAIEDALCQL